MPITDLTGTTWVFNDSLNISDDITWNVNYTTNSEDYTDLRISLQSSPMGNEPCMGTAAFPVSFYNMGAWQGEAYKTITITGGTDATNSALISWLEANATQQAVSTKVSVDLTTLPGWSSLSDGSHSVTIVAKADGYRDSEPSAAVSVTKQSIVADKATITGLGNSSPTSQTYSVDSGFPTSFEEVTKDGDIFIKIPTMYRKVNTVSSNQITSFTISNAKEDDSYYPYPCFVRPDGSVMDYILIGKYMISSSSTANSVNASNVTLTPAQGIALCKNKGAGYYPYDVWTQKLFQDLELAIGKKVNYQDGSAKITVSKIGLNHLDKGHWVLGVIGSSGSWYACYDPDKYQALGATNSPIPQDYVQIGYVQPTTNNVEIQKLGYDESNPFFNYPTATVSNGYDTYYCDQYAYRSGNRPVFAWVGSSLAYNGLWRCGSINEWSSTSAVRLCFRPLNENAGTNLISFTIAGTSYQAEEGMTWNE